MKFIVNFIYYLRKKINILVKYYFNKSRNKYYNLYNEFIIIIFIYFICIKRKLKFSFVFEY